MNPNWLMFLFGSCITWAAMTWLYGWPKSLRGDERLLRRIGLLEREEIEGKNLVQRLYEAAMRVVLGGGGNVKW